MYKLFKIISLVTLLFSFSCSKKSSENNEVVFKESLGGDITTTDPHKMDDNNSFAIILNCFEGLFRLNEKTSFPEYALAKSYSVSSDGLKYTFVLRNNLLFSDETPITAQVFVDSWQRAVDPRTGGGMSYLLAHILKNGDAIQKGELPRSDLGVRAIDDKTLEVYLAFPAPYLTSILALPISVPLPMHLVDSREDDWNRTFPIVSNGSYVIEEWKPNNKVVLRKNPLYYDADKISIDKVVVYTTDDINTAYRMYLNGEIDFLANLSTDLAQEAQSRDDFYTSYYTNGNYYIFNTQIKPFNDVRVRKALTIAIDRETLTQKVLKSSQKSLYSFIYEMPNYPSKKYVKEDVEEAKRLLAEAGYPDGKGFPPFNLIYNTDDSFKKIAEFIQQEWKEKLGIDFSLQNLEWKTFISTLLSHDYQVIQSRWIPDYPDPLGSLYFFDPRAPYTNYKNDKYMKLLDESNFILSLKDRMNKLAEAEKTLMEDYPCSPIFVQFINSLINTRKWEGTFSNPMNQVMYRAIRLKEGSNI